MRDFGDGYVAILLPAYLTALGYSTVKVGVIATTALLGSSIITLAVGLFGGRHDLRRLLIAASVLMTVTGMALSVAWDFGFLLLVARNGKPVSGKRQYFRSP